MKTILFQGDSITDSGRGRGVDGADYLGSGYPTMVAGRLGRDYPCEYRFVNRGVGGDRSIDIYNRMKEDIIDVAPDYMSLLVGVNDIWHGFASDRGIEADEFERIYDKLLTEVKEALPNIKIILFEPFLLPGPLMASNAKIPDREERFKEKLAIESGIIERLAVKHGARFVPLQAKFSEACRHADTRYWIIDGVHPTPAGHGIIADEWLKAFSEIK